MPIRLVPYELANGHQIIVEEEVVDRGDFAANTAGGLAAKAKRSFEDALSSIRPSIAVVMEQVASLADRPDKITLELGFVLKGEVGAVLAKTATEGSIKLSLTWESRKT